ncbi:MAG: hypothetical protein ACP5RS_07095 [Thermoplasmata archaeon]
MTYSQTIKKKIFNLSDDFTKYSMVSLFLASIVLLTSTSLSQTFGYLAFLFLLFSFIIIFYTYEEDKKPIVKQKSNEWVFLDIKKFIAVNLVVSTILILVAEYYTIFSHGYIYSNIDLMRIFYPFSLLYGYAGNGQGFIVQAFYLNWEAYLPISTIAYEKVAIITSIYFYYFIVSFVSITVYRAIGIYSLDQYTFSILFSILFVANFIFYSNGYSSMIIGPLMISYSIAKIYEALKFERFLRKDALKIGWAISFGIFGDPRTLAYFFIIIVGILISVAIKRYNLIKTLKFALNSFYVIMPAFAVMFLFVSFVNGTPQYNAGRLGDVGTIQFFSSSTQPMFVWDFMANWWSGFVMAPPSFVYVNQSNPYNIWSLQAIHAGNVIMILPPHISMIDVIWSISLSVISLLAILSFYLMKRDENNRRLAYLLLPFFLLFVLTLGTNIEYAPIVEFVSFLSTIPIVGNFWAVTVSTPQFIDVYFSPFLIFFAVYSILFISQYLSTEQNNAIIVGKKHMKKNDTFIKKIKKVKIQKYVFVSIVLILFLFANWQFLDQKYSLGIQDYGQLPGNEVSLKAWDYPVNPPSGFVNAYDMMYSPTNLSYTSFINLGALTPTKWDMGMNPFSNPGITPNTEFVNLLYYYSLLNESSIIPTLMKTYGVKYILFDKTLFNPLIEISPNTYLNETKMYYTLLNSNLKIAVNNKNFTLFALNNTSSLYASSLGISLNDSPSNTMSLLNLLEMNGINAVIVNGTKSVVNFNSHSIENNTAFYYPFQSIVDLYPTNYINGFSKFNTSMLPGEDNINVGDGWNATRWNAEYYANFSANNNTLTIKESNGNYPYSSRMILDVWRSIAIPSNMTTVVNYQFTYSFNANINLNVNNNPLFAIGQTYVTLVSPAYNKTVSGSVITQPGLNKFNIDFHLTQMDNNTFIVKNLMIKYSFLKNSYLVKSPPSLNVHAYPDQHYEFFYYGYNSFSPVYGKYEVVSLPNGTIPLNLTNIGEISCFALVPYNLITEQSRGTFVYPQFSEDGALIQGYIGKGYTYLAVSYNPLYKWDLSNNLKYLGDNILGQQVFEILNEGEISLHIKYVDAYTWLDYSSAIAMNVVLPFFLFVPNPVDKTKRIKMMLFTKLKKYIPYK